MKFNSILIFFFLIFGLFHSRIHGLETFDPDHPELVIPGDEPIKRIAIIGYYFRQDYTIPADQDAAYVLALISKQSWALYATDNNYDFIWRDDNTDIPREMRTIHAHPRWYKYKFLAEVLRPVAEGGLGYDAALIFEADTFWTGSHRHLSLETYLYSFPRTHLFIGHSFALKSEDLPSGPQYTVHPSHAGFQLDPSVMLFVSTKQVVKALQDVYEDALELPGSEATVLKDTFPPVLVTSNVHQNGTAHVLRSISLGTTFVAPSILWESSHFALHLMPGDKKSNVIKETLRTANKLVSLHTRHRDLTKFELSKIPIFPLRSQTQLSSD